MNRLYYQPNNLWKGKADVKKLAEYSKEKPKVIKQWLSRKAFWQVHLPAPKRIDRPHYQVTIPNEMHQFDQSGIDAASRYKVMRQLRMKQARDVAGMIANIYKVGPLMYPKIFQCYNGSEFKGEVTKLLEKHEVKIRRVTTNMPILTQHLLKL